MTIKRRTLYKHTHSNSAMKEALLKAGLKNRGYNTVVEPKKVTASVRKRIKQLSDLVHSTYVSNVPRGHRRQYDVYRRATSKIIEISKGDKSTYEDALATVKYTWTSPESYQDTLRIIG